MTDSSQVTQRPGWSCLATSVNTLTTGSHATVTLRSPDFSKEGAEEPLRDACATGTRTRTEVSDRPSGRIEIVCVSTPDRATPAARSALTARLMVVAGETQTISIRPDGLSDTSVLVRV